MPDATRVLLDAAKVAAALGALALAAHGANLAWRRARQVVTPARRRRVALFERGWTLEVEPDRVRLAVQPGPLALPAGAVALLALWLVFVMPLVRPLLDPLPGLADPRGAAASQYMRSPFRVVQGLLLLGLALYALRHALTRVDLVLEARGDLRCSARDPFGAQEWSIPPAWFDSLDVVEPGQQVLLRCREGPGQPYERLFVFHTARAPVRDLVDDVAAASAAFADLARRRAAES